MKDFDDATEALIWFEHSYLWDEDNVDNFRFAYIDDSDAMEDFKAARKRGCCGSSEIYVSVLKRKALIGANFGH